jgi:hypothetical protein
MRKAQVEEHLRLQQKKNKILADALRDIRSQAQQCDSKGSTLRNGWLIQTTTEALENGV